MKVISEFLLFPGIKSIETFASGSQGCDELIQFVNVLVSIMFHVTVRNNFEVRFVRSANEVLMSPIVEKICTPPALKSFSDSPVFLLLLFWVSFFVIIV